MNRDNRKPHEDEMTLCFILVIEDVRAKDTFIINLVVDQKTTKPVKVP